MYTHKSTPWAFVELLFHWFVCATGSKTERVVVLFRTFFVGIFLFPFSVVFERACWCCRGWEGAFTLTALAVNTEDVTLMLRYALGSVSLLVSGVGGCAQVLFSIPVRWISINRRKTKSVPEAEAQQCREKSWHCLYLISSFGKNLTNSEIVQNDTNAGRGIEIVFRCGAMLVISGPLQGDNLHFAAARTPLY